MRLFLYLLALLTGLSVADANPSARAAPVAVDTIFVAQRNASNPARQRSSVPCTFASGPSDRPPVVLMQNVQTASAMPVPAAAPQGRCDRLLE
ncbi:MAG: hypothetical protein IPN84_07825 [Sphingomonadales bacterium]|nr:hypothetical protein [Sphingomonadales bacterium]